MIWKREIVDGLKVYNSGPYSITELYEGPGYQVVFAGNVLNLWDPVKTLTEAKETAEEHDRLN